MDDNTANNQNGNIIHKIGMQYIHKLWIADRERYGHIYPYYRNLWGGIKGYGERIIKKTIVKCHIFLKNRRGLKKKCFL